MPDPITGVFPCYENQFKIGAAGSSTPSTPIADMESYSLSIDNGVEEWRAYGDDGWIKRLMTAKSIKLSVKGKRNIGDAGNDMVAGCFMANGRAAEKNVLWTFPDGATLLLANAVINVTNMNTGDATNVGPLEWDAMSNGKPTYTPAA